MRATQDHQMTAPLGGRGVARAAPLHGSRQRRAAPAGATRRAVDGVVSPGARRSRRCEGARAHGADGAALEVAGSAPTAARLAAAPPPPPSRNAAAARGENAAAGAGARARRALNG